MSRAGKIHELSPASDLSVDMVADGARVAAPDAAQSARSSWRQIARQRRSAALLGQAMAKPNPRRRLIAPLSDFVSALRMAIAAFGQDEAGAERELSPRQAAEVAPFLDCSLLRTEDETVRIVFVGELSPYGGVVEFLACASAWAERHPNQRIDISWVGHGDLRLVLRAQWTPSNVDQWFLPQVEAGTLPALFERSSFLAVPNLSEIDPLPLAQAMAAGLPVLGSARCPQVRQLVVPAVTGWLFDPLSGDTMATALDRALTTPEAALLDMRMAARNHVAALCAERLGAVEGTPWIWRTDMVATNESA